MTLLFSACNGQLLQPCLIDNEKFGQQIDIGKEYLPFRYSCNYYSAYVIFQWGISDWGVWG